MPRLYSYGISENSLPSPLILQVNKRSILEVPTSEPLLAYVRKNRFHFAFFVSVFQPLPLGRNDFSR
jgi:hypothetical protein